MGFVFVTCSSGVESSPTAITFPPVDRPGAFKVEGEAEGGKGFRLTGGVVLFGVFGD